MSNWFYFILWENALMKFWTFSFWKCIYKCMIFFWNAYIIYVWMIFLWENAFMKFWIFSFRKCIYKCMIFFLDLFLFSFNMYACINFFENAYINGIFGMHVRNSRKMHKRFCECIHRYSQVDFVLRISIRHKKSGFT